MGKTIGQWTAELREINIKKGWRHPDGPKGNTWGDYVALLHSEISEALEAFRDWRLADRTGEAQAIATAVGDARPVKPEGVGSELADVFVRLLDMCDVFGIEVFDMDMEIGDVSGLPVAGAGSFGDHLAGLHSTAAEMWNRGQGKPGTSRGLWPIPAVLLRELLETARTFGIDLEAEVERKVAFNRTRAFQHGGRTMAPKMAAVPERSAMDWVRGSVPDDPRGWWTGDEAGELIGTWGNAGLPQVKVADVTGEVLTLWVADLKAAVEKLGVAIYDATMGIEIKQGAYVVNVVQAK